jgi:hypothetical protein
MALMPGQLLKKRGFTHSGVAGNTKQLHVQTGNSAYSSSALGSL